MITDFLLDHAALVPATLFAAAAACAGLGYLVLRRAPRPRRTAGMLAAAALLAVLALTLAPSTRGRGGPVTCTVQFALPSPGSVELLANLALLLPVALFATLATRRPWPLLAAACTLPVAVEAAQALLPAIGRACDTNDWLMNALGGSAGVALAVLVLGLVGDPAPSPLGVSRSRGRSGAAPGAPTEGA